MGCECKHGILKMGGNICYVMRYVNVMMTFTLCSCDEESQGLFEDLFVNYSEEVVGKLWGSFSDG